MKSRTEYSAKNTTVSVICRILAIIMGYVLRIVFTHQLSSTYVGINGLFVDIIQVLSLSEMGVGTAITFALYQPVADGDIEKQKSLMRLFRHLEGTVNSRSYHSSFSPPTVFPTPERLDSMQKGTRISP